MSRFTNIAVILATSCLALATPGNAQTAQDDARFRQAQQRLQNELSLFQQEFDRYQQASRNRRGGGYGGPGGYNNAGPGGYNNAGPGGYYPNDDRVESGYDPARYYRDGPNYQERVLGPDDRVYRGNDGRYYCKRNDGTTGLIVGAIGGGILGNVIDGGHSRGVGTILGAIVGGVAGQSIDRNNQQVKCR
ncbi:MAG: glycine zipper 2TM domain-containing protein [Pseudomonadota bacterium]